VPAKKNASSKKTAPAKKNLPKPKISASQRWVRVLNLFAILGGSLALSCWMTSYSSPFEAVWTSGDQLNRVISYRGTIVLWQNRSWWRDEPFGIEYDLREHSEPIVDWPGLHLNSSFTLLGFTMASGMWTSPKITVPEGTRFRPHHNPAPVGAVLTYSTRMTLYGVPCWAPVLASGAWMFRRVFRKKVPDPVDSKSQKIVDIQSGSQTSG